MNDRLDTAQDLIGSLNKTPKMAGMVRCPIHLKEAKFINPIKTPVNANRVEEAMLYQAKWHVFLYKLNTDSNHALNSLRDCARWK